MLSTQAPHLSLDVHRVSHPGRAGEGDAVHARSQQAAPAAHPAGCNERTLLHPPHHVPAKGDAWWQGTRDQEANTMRQHNTRQQCMQRSIHGFVHSTMENLESIQPHALLPTMQQTALFMTPTGSGHTNGVGMLRHDHLRHVR